MLTIPRSCPVLLSTLLLVLPALTTRAADEQPSAADREKELLAVLQSDAPAAEKAITCKNLAIYGSDLAVPELAKLLPDPQLSSWARIALEAIPGEAANEALRSAADSLQGLLLVGTINSLGVRRDAGAVELLAKHLQNQDNQVAAAAAVALGRIGNTAAADLLRQQLAAGPAETRTHVAEGLVLCGERLLAEGKPAAAVEIYDKVRQADVPLQRIVESTRGAILSRGSDGIPLLLEQFRSSEKVMFQLALSTAREFPGAEVDTALAAELETSSPDRAALIIQAMADRPNTVVLTAIQKSAEKGPKQVRLSAIEALRRVGDDSCLASLLDVATESDADVAQAARGTLAELPGAGVDERIVERLKTASGSMYPLLLELIGQRRIDAVPDVLKALDHSDKAVRGAALIALGETVDLTQLPVLVTQVVAPKFPEDTAIAQQALKAASVRMPDREACAAELTNAMKRSSSATTKTSLLEILGAMGGPRALAAMNAAATDADPRLQDASTRLLGEWMTADAAPVLLNLVQTAPGEKYQVRALRGYIRIARQFVLPDAQRSEMCRKAFYATERTAERKLVLAVLERYPNVENLKLALEAQKIPALKNDAAATTLKIAQKLSSKGIDVSPLLNGAGLDNVKLEIIKAEYGAGTTQKDVTEIVRKQVGDLPLITLAAAGYNASFGGDPVPGTAKQLRIQYRMNGRTGETTFAENALILLPMPK